MKHSGGEIRQLIITVPTDAVYNFYIQNPDGTRIYQQKNKKGNLNVNEPIATIAGIHTLGIENADIDGIYTVKLTFRGDW